jgi:tetratricopeptide (TPR) repeat protein
LVRRLLGVCIACIALASTGCRSTVRYEELAQEYFNLGNAYFEAGDYDRSYLYYTRALEYDRDFPAAGFNLARLYIERDEPVAALDVLDRLLEDDRSNTLYLETRAFALALAGRVPEARVAYRSLLSGDGARPRVAYNLALLEVDAGNASAALDVLAENARFAQDDAEYIWLHAEVLFAEGSEEDARRRLDRYTGLVRDDPRALARLVRRYAEWDFNLAALDLLATFEPAADEAPELAFLEGRLLLEATNDFERGIERIESALREGYREIAAYAELTETLPPDELPILTELLERYDVDVSRVEQRTPDTEPPERESGASIDLSGDAE